jgi:hypothetical protein
MLSRSVQRKFSFTDLHKKQLKRIDFVNRNKIAFIPFERSFLPINLKIEHYLKNHKIKSFLMIVGISSVLYWDWATCNFYHLILYIQFM